MISEDNSGKKKRRPLAARWKVFICLMFFLTLLIATWLLGQRFESVRTVTYKAVAPFEQLFGKIGSWVSGTQEDLADNEQMRRSVEELTKQVEALEEENRQLQTEARRAQELETLYELDTFYKDYPKIGAQIVGLSANNWYDTFILDKGTADGMQKYLPVLADGGIAGHISEVYEHYSVVSSVVNQNSVIYGQINRQNGDLVVVQGASGFTSTDTGIISDDICLVRFKTADVDIAVGDEIVTSSLGDIYPRGLPIGTVTKIVPAANGYESIAYVKPCVVLDQTDMVLVITELWKEDMNREMNNSGDDQ